MGRKFNVTADCKANLHYMVDISSRLEQIKRYVDSGEYFVINRARQYGKTTTLRALKEYLKGNCYVISMDFQVQMSHAKFRNENTFCVAFAKAFTRIAWSLNVEFPQQMKTVLECLERAVQEGGKNLELVELFQYLSDICRYADRPLVMMIDEVDSAANDQVFLDFLAQLRGYYIDRDISPTFQSVILAGVYDIKNMKYKIRPDAEHKRNSPWNIAADFNVDMSFSAADISGMLLEYEAEHHTGMDIAEMAGMIYSYTSGYPFLVSYLCKVMDERLPGQGDFQDRKAAWTRAGFLEAAKVVLTEKNTLFESMVNKLADFPELRNMVYTLLFHGKEIPYNSLNKAIETAEMFGFIKREENRAVISNRIFETVLYNLFLSEEVAGSEVYKAALQDKNQFIQGGRLNMELVLQKFVTAFHDLYGDRTEAFQEDVGRKYFMLFLKPIINGVGNSYVEAQTRDLKRTDIIVDYRGEQFIVELKLWHGQEYNNRGEKQLSEYLDFYHLNKGYLLSYNFNKHKKVGVNEVRIGDKVLIEAIV